MRVKPEEITWCQSQCRGAASKRMKIALIADACMHFPAIFRVALNGCNRASAKNFGGI